MKIGFIWNAKFKECDRCNLFGLKFNQWNANLIEMTKNGSDLKSKVAVGNQVCKYESYQCSAK